MNSEVLCDIIREKNIQLSKEQIKRIEDFAIRAEDPEVALALCCYTFDADVSKMLDVIINSKDLTYAAGFAMNYDGTINSEDFSKLQLCLNNVPIYKNGGDLWINTMNLYSTGMSRCNSLKENLDNGIKRIGKRIQKAEKTEHDVLAK